MVWIFDATDRSGYELTTSYYGTNSVHNLVADYCVGDDVNSWYGVNECRCLALLRIETLHWTDICSNVRDLNNDMQFIADVLEGILGSKKIPAAIRVRVRLGSVIRNNLFSFIWIAIGVSSPCFLPLNYIFFCIVDDANVCVIVSVCQGQLGCLDWATFELLGVNAFIWDFR